MKKINASVKNFYLKLREKIYNSQMKIYKLLSADGKIYESNTPGQFGGNSKAKIYGRLDCPSALR